jgi:hypothetical protein
MIETLTDLFDSPSKMVISTHKRGEEIINNVGLAFLGCCNEEWLAHSIPLHAFGGGFMGRMLAIYQGGTDREFPKPPPLDVGMKEGLIDALKLTEGLHGEAKLTGEAEGYYKRRYKKVKAKFPEDERLAPFWERYSIHLLRLSMLLSVSRDLSQFGDVTVTEGDIRAADAILKWVHAKLPVIYSFLGTTDFGDEARRVLQFIQRRGGTATDGEIKRKVARRMSKSRLDECLRTLRSAGYIKSNKSPAAWDGELEWRLVRKVEGF